MRSGALLVFVAVAAGCYDDTPGVRVVIHDPGFGAEHVELFLSTRTSPTKKIAPDQARPMEPRGKLIGTNTFLLDGPMDGVTPLSRLALQDGRAVWELHADPENAHVEALVAVAFDANNTAIAVAHMSAFEVPTTETVAYRLDLQAATQVQPSETADPPGLRVWLWRKSDAATAACLALEHSDGQQVTERAWLVPEDDTDCDEVDEPVDCDKFYWHADKHLNFGIDDANCFTSTTLTTPNGPVLRACKVGARACIDGAPPNTCTAFTGPKYCAANLLCNAAGCTGDPTSCQIADSSLVTATFNLDQLGGQCANPDQMGFGPVHVKLGGVFGRCTNVAFTPTDIMNGGIVPSNTHVDGAATYTIENFDPANCAFDLSLTGSTAISALPVPLLLALDVTRSLDHIVLPFLLTPIAGPCVDPSVSAVQVGLGEAFDACQ